MLEITLFILKPTEFTPLHEAVMRKKCELVLCMINVVRSELSPLPSPNQDHREQQIKLYRSQPSDSDYETINRKNKVRFD